MRSKELLCWPLLASGLRFDLCLLGRSRPPWMMEAQRRRSRPHWAVKAQLPALASLPTQGRLSLQAWAAAGRWKRLANEHPPRQSEHCRRKSCLQTWLPERRKCPPPAERSLPPGELPPGVASGQQNTLRLGKEQSCVAYMRRPHRSAQTSRTIIQQASLDIHVLGFADILQLALLMHP